MENLQQIGISSVIFWKHAFMKTLKKNISEAYRVKFDCVKDLETDP